MGVGIIFDFRKGIVTFFLFVIISLKEKLLVPFSTELLLGEFRALHFKILYLNLKYIPFYHIIKNALEYDESPKYGNCGQV